MKLEKGEIEFMKKSKRAGMVLVAGILFFNSVASVNGLAEHGMKEDITADVSVSNTNIEKKWVMGSNDSISVKGQKENKQAPQEEKGYAVGSLMAVTGEGQTELVNSKDIYGKNSTFQFTIEDGYEIEEAVVEDEIHSYLIQCEEKKNSEQKTYQFTLPEIFIKDTISSDNTNNSFSISIKGKKVADRGTETSGEAVSVSDKVITTELETIRRFSNIQIEFTTPKLKLSSTSEDQWSDKDIIITLENEAKNPKADTVFYVRESEKSQWIKLDKTNSKEDENGRKIYVISNNVNSKYQFKAQYDLIAGEMSDQGDINIKIDKEIPVISVKQSTYGWTEQDVIFQLSNSNKKSSSALTYYVSKNNGKTWEKITKIQPGATCKYIVSEECKEAAYQFKVISEVGEDAEIYTNTLKSWISRQYTVFIDKTAPKIPSIKLNNENSNTASKKWFNQSPEVIISEQQDSGSPITSYYYLYKEGQEKGEKKNYGTDPIKLKGSGKYILEAFSQDYAGNTTDKVTTAIKLDTKKPEKPNITFTSKTGEPITFVNYKKYQLFSNEPIIVTIQAEDNFSGIASIVYKSVGNQIIKETKKSGSAVSFAISPIFMGGIQAYAVDEAGNISDTAESSQAAIEQNKPSISINTDLDNNKWQNRNIEFKINVADTQAGIAEIEYILNGKIINKVDFTSAKQFVTTYNKVVKATEEAADSQGYELKVNVIDNAGNLHSTTKKVYIDKTAPVIQINGIAPKSISNQSKTLTVSVEEKIYQYNKVNISVVRMVDGKSVPYNNPSFSSNQIKSVKDITFTQDGVYIVTVQAEDKAGNKAKEQKLEFTIDKTNPVISISGTENKKLHGNTVNLTIGVIESNFKNNKVNISVKKQLEEKVKEYTISDWENTGKNSSLVTAFSEDGTYMVKVSATDQAGNTSKIQTVRFVVDKTAPKITISNVKPYQVTDGKINFGFMISELNYKENGIEVEVVKEDVSGKKKAIALGTFKSTKRNADFIHLFEEEGKYTVTLKATDKVGNVSSKQQIFTIDSEAPIIKNLKQYNKKYLKSFSIDGSINEWVKDITPVSYKIYLDGAEYDGVSKITENGKHVLKIEAIDEMMHKSTRTIEFMIDNQAPEISFDGMVNGEKVLLNDNDIINKKTVITVSLGDGDDFIETLLINGKAEKIGKNVKKYEIPVNRIGDYAIQVKANDLAGNQTDKTLNIRYADPSVEATAKTTGISGGESDTLTNKSNDNNILLYVYGIAACIVAGGIIFVIISGKKKGKTK